jgi:hypothetical protein
MAMIPDSWTSSKILSYVLEDHGVGETTEEGLGDPEGYGEEVNPAVGKEVTKGVHVNDGETDVVANGVCV